MRVHYEQGVCHTLNVSDLTYLNYSADPSELKITQKNLNLNLLIQIMRIFTCFKRNTFYGVYKTPSEIKNM